MNEPGDTSDPNTATALRFFELLESRLLDAKDVESMGSLWHQQASLTVPYPASGFPNRIDGRAAIVEAFTGLMPNYTSFRSTIIRVYPSPSTDSVVVEYKNDAILKSGTTYTNDNIAVFRFEDQLISEYHDYFDPRRFQVVVDELS